MNTELEQGTITDVSVTNDLYEWVEAFIQDRQAQQLADGTVSFYRKKLKKFLGFSLAQQTEYLEQVTSQHIRRYLLYLQGEGHNQGGIHAHYRCVRALLRWYEQEAEPLDWRNPVSKVKAPRVDLEPLEPVETEVIKALLGVCGDEFCGLRDRAIILALLDSGCRAGEFLSVDTSDFDTKTGEILLKKTKSHKPRFVFTGKATRRAILRYLDSRSDDEPALWVTRSLSRLKYAGLRMVILRKSNQAGLEKAPSLHSFRRSFAINALRNGVDVYSLQHLMGHADLQVLRRYLAQDKQDLQSAHRKASPVDNLLQG